MTDQTESLSFDVEQVKNIMREAVDRVLVNQAYQAKLVDGWCSEIVDVTLKGLAELEKPFKYIVNCIIVQRTGSGLNTASSCHWDSSTDESVTFHKDFPTLHCVVTTFGLAI
eukprot:c10166_g1_i3.p1 GENE.c10166_g1_i3~~c10166_g1_i3.p1  ORF type:complete len:112 (-),score=32.93 c10166_g1_i3:134-469(-)